MEYKTNKIINKTEKKERWKKGEKRTLGVLTGNYVAKHHTTTVFFFPYSFGLSWFLYVSWNLDYKMKTNQRTPKN